MNTKLTIRPVSPLSLEAPPDNQGHAASRRAVWRGDMCTFAFAVTSDTDVTELEAVIEPIRYKNQPAAIKAQPCFVKRTRAFPGKGKRDDGSRGAYPEILYGNKTRLQIGRPQYLWIRIQIPRDAQPGAYRACVTLSHENKVLAETALEWEVLPLTLPEPGESGFDLELWQYPYRLAQYYGAQPFSEKHLRILQDHMRLYRELGGHAITASIVEEPWNGQTYGQYPSMIRWIRRRNRSWRFDFDHFDRWVELNLELGIGDKIICYSPIPWGNRIRYYDERKGRMAAMAPRTRSRTYRRIWTAFLEALMAHTDARGWSARIFIGFDERRHKEKAFSIVEQVREQSGLPFRIAAAMDHFSADYVPLIDRVHSVSIGSEAVKKAPEEFCRLVKRREDDSRALDTTIYTCVGHFPNSFTYSLPGESYWTPLYCAGMGATGFLRWALDAWVENPLEETTHTSFESGDCFLVYPDPPDAAF
ncbi:MAG: DUF4091 domain-containing protein, partial [Clostridiales bacterium]|nr:DUF4091 domain-containing protein [Clostridiales bacterium]